MSEVKNFDKIEGTLVYVQMQTPVKAFVKPGFPVKPDEWKASVVIVDEDVLDDFEAFVTSIDAGTSIKKVKAAEFEEKYKCPVPEGAGKNVWVITFRKSTQLGKTGKPVPEQYKPRVYQKKGNTLVDVTATSLPANGSKGVISIDRFDRDNGTASLYLKNVLVTEMIEYIKPEGSGSSYEPGSEFGSEAPTKAPTKPVEAQKTPAATQAKASPKKAPSKLVEPEEDFLDSPF